MSRFKLGSLFSVTALLGCGSVYTGTPIVKQAPQNCGRSLIAGPGGSQSSACVPIPKRRLETQLNLTADRYGSCAEVKESLSAVRSRVAEGQKKVGTAQQDIARANNPPASAKSAVPEANNSSSSDGASITSDITSNLQEAGVEEADAFRLNDDNIFALKGKTLFVVNRATKQLVGNIPNFSVGQTDLYAKGKLLIAVDVVYKGQNSGDVPENASANVGSAAFLQGNSSVSSDAAEPAQVSSSEPVANLPIQTRVRVFKTSLAGLPTLVSDRRYAGVPVDSRMEGGRLFLGVKYDFGNISLENMEAATSISNLGCNSIVKPLIESTSQSLTTLHSIPIEPDAGVESSLSLLGDTSQMYMAPGSIYLSNTVMNWNNDPIVQVAMDSVRKNSLMPRTVPQGEASKNSSNSAEEFTFIQAVRVNQKGEFGDLSLGGVPGRTKDIWAFKELGANGEYLSVATTSGQLWGAQKSRNDLWVLKRNGAQLSKASSVEKFGIGEDIRSVRYVDNKAYVVTFKKTDPLYVVSLAEPENAKLLGELKVPGFSTYMHPVENNLLIGLGFDAKDEGDFAWYQGIQLSLFNVENPLKPERLDVKVLGERGSSSAATSNHQAFFFDAEQKILAIPVVLLKNDAASTGGWASNSSAAAEFSGVIFYSVANGKLEEISRVSHASWLPKPCLSELTRFQWWESSAPSLDVARVYKLDGNYLTLSPFGIKEWNSSSLFTEKPSPIKETPFQALDCAAEAGRAKGIFYASSTNRGSGWFAD